jgi:hypothetical protein
MPPGWLASWLAGRLDRWLPWGCGRRLHLAGAPGHALGRWGRTPAPPPEARSRPPCPAQHNPFSLAFDKACELADILPESVLDACVVSINSDEVEGFLEQLDTAYHSVHEGNV